MMQMRLCLIFSHLREAERAEFALVGLLAGVDPEMLRQSARVAESLLAQPASEGRKRGKTSIDRQP